MKKKFFEKQMAGVCYDKISPNLLVAMDYEFAGKKIEVAVETDEFFPVDGIFICYEHAAKFF